jgi:hypothetical protein
MERAAFLNEILVSECAPCHFDTINVIKTNPIVATGISGTPMTIDKIETEEKGVLQKQNNINC